MIKSDTKWITFILGALITVVLGLSSGIFTLALSKADRKEFAAHVEWAIKTNTDIASALNNITVRLSTINKCESNPSLIVRYPIQQKENDARQ